MPLYEYECSCLGITFKQCTIDERNKERICPQCGKVLKRLCRNDGGFRLGKNGSVGWSEDGFATYYGDAENFKAGRKVY